MKFVVESPVLEEVGASDDLSEKFASKYTKALVTGGAGFIGSHICEKLVQIGIEVVSLDDFSAGKESNIEHLKKYKNFASVTCDITNKSQLKEHLQEVDIIFHNAASKKNICLKDPARDLEVNARGPLQLLELAKQNNVKKFVHASTGSVYGEAQYFPQDEDHPLNPASYYGVSKLAGEKYVNLYNELYDMDTTILRYFHVYGPRQESNEYGGVVSIFIRNLLNNEVPIIFGDGTQERSFTYVKDIVTANLLVALDKNAKGQVYNCASGITVTVQELCAKTIDYFGMKGKVEPKFEDWLVGDIKIFNVGNEKIRSLGLKFEKDFFKILQRMVQEEL